MPRLKSQLSILLLLFSACVAHACDICGCYIRSLEPSNVQAAPQHPVDIFTSISEQFTHFGTDRLDGTKVANPTGEYLNSSITQLALGASFFKDRLSIQTNVPLIYRSFKRPEGFGIEHGTVSGPGDMSLTANFVVLNREGLLRQPKQSESGDGKSGEFQNGEPDYSVMASLSLGLKLPTGDSGELGQPEVDVEGAPQSGIGGHDLTLGTGSVDGVFGFQTLLRYKSLFFQADTQFGWRGRGSYSYRFANDLTWSGGPGVYFLRKNNKSLALQFVLSGETKGYDQQNGEPLTDTGVTSLFLGPRLLGNIGRFSCEAGVDFPVIMNTTDFQTTPTYRIRAGLTYQF